MTQFSKEVLTSTLMGTDTNSKKEVLMYIAEHRYQISLPLLYPLLKDEDRQIRAITAFALGKIGDQSTIPFLSEAWFQTANEERHLKRQILIALSDIATFERLIPLFKNFKDWSEEDKMLAVDCFESDLAQLLDYEIDSETKYQVINYLLKGEINSGTRIK